MGGSSSKRHFLWQKKKKSPLDKAWGQLKGALPGEKHKKKKKKKKNILPLDKLRSGKKSQKRFSLPTDKRQPAAPKRFSLGNTRKESTASLGKDKDVLGGLGKVGEQIKRKFSVPAAQHQETVDVKYKWEENKPANGADESKRRLSAFMKPLRP